jgi:hypothetical protein
MSDEKTLKSWNFLDEYQKNEKQLVDLAKSVYLVTCDLVGTPPNQSECYDLYWKSLFQTSLYQDMLKRKHHVKPIFYEAFVQMLARHVLAQKWTTDIYTNQCP